MIDKLIHFSIKNKLVIGLFTFALIIWGYYSVTQLSIDAVPDITNNQAQIITSSPSLAAQEIERLVTFPIEQTMATIPEIVEIRSMSRFGLSVVTVVFKDNTDIYWARQQISERIQEAKNVIPAGAGNPELAPVSTGLGEIYQYTLHAKKGFEKKYNAMELRTVQDWIVRRQLLGTDGVADVSSFGGLLKQYEIALNPAKLRSMNISINEIFTALEKNNQNTGGAYIDKDPNAYFIRSEGLISNINDIESIVIKSTSQGIPVLVRDVAKVQFGHATRYGALTYNDKGEAVGGLVLMLKGRNSNKVIDNIKERIKQIEKSLPEGVMIEPFLDRSKLVERAIGTVKTNLLEGALIVLFVLVLFLGNMRAGLIVASVIPLAMLFAISMMNLFGVSGNLMSLGAIDFGLIVDGAVIIVEASLHHLMKSKGKRLSQNEMDEEVYESAIKIRSSAAFGEIIILIVYLPILALAGIEGKMFKPMAQTVAFAIMGAFILSLTYVPMVSAMFLNKHVSEKRTISDRMMDFFQRIYNPIINGALKKKALVVIIAFSLFVVSLIIFLNMGGEFIPTLEEGDFAVETRVLTGSSMQKTIEASNKAAKILMAEFPEVKSVVGKIGAGEIPTDPMPVEACDLMIILKDKKEWTSAETREELAEKMAEALEAIPGVSFGFQQPIQMRFNELMSGAKQDVAIKIFGEDLDELTKVAGRIGKLVNSTAGAKDLYIEQVSGLPQIVIRYNRAKIAQFGLNITDINNAIQTSFAGQSAGLVYESEKRFDLVVRLEQDNRKGLEDVQGLYITAPNGNQVPLSQVAEVNIELGPNQIQREDAKRRLTIGFNVRGRDVESIVKDLEQKINKQIKMPSGYFIKFGGQFENLIEAKARLVIAVPIALLLIIMLLYFTFGSIKQSILIFTAIPLSAIGGIFALLLRGMPFSISAGVGFIALFGVAVLNGIVLIGEFNLLKKEGLTDLREIVLKGTRVRLRPVLMTATVASLGFLPMALSTGAGGEVQKPLATVVIGGLISATFLTLVVLPVLYIYFEKGIKKIKPVIPIVLLTLIFGSANAQKPTTYSMDKCVEEAIKNNASIKAGMYEIDLQKKLKSTSTDIGKTNVSLMYGQYNSYNKTDNNISINQTIPFPTVFISNAAFFEAQVKASTLKLGITKQELIYRVKSAYTQLQYFYALDKLLLQQDSIFNEFVRIATLRYKTGDGTLLEKSTAESRLQEIHNIQLRNRSDIAISQTQLQTLMNTSNIIQVENSEFKKMDLGIETLDTSAYKMNPSITYFEQQIEIAKQQKRIEQNKLLPDITLGYFNQTLIGYQNVNGQDRYFGQSDRFQGIQIGLAIPLWFVPQAAKISANKINQQIAQTTFEGEQRNLEGRYKQALQEYLQLKYTLDNYTKYQIPQGKLISEQSQKAFATGEIGYFEHSQNLVQSLQIQSEYLSLINQFNQSAYQVQIITGKL